ncbi:MAG: Segregation and condensation protein B [Parcubacteria group bacterium GW2011_GWA1_47_8]|nr:MAG: Segregation and condensation protein B [Parcubacteria group bacterium GW2011_GWA1_47_8]KKW07721.1 MAG: Segregation and condensation protein B [Parcubacteria group bacterium GW2011_GWA2_49_16]
MEFPIENSARIEALLFYKGEPLSAKFLAKTLAISEDEVRAGIEELSRSLEEGRRGLVLVQNGDEVMLATTPAMGPVIEKLLKEELSKDLGKAGLETLAAVLYRGPITRSEINYLRGVNSNYILRSLLVRGLIEKVEQGTRNTTYRPTFELLSYLGVARVEDLPEYEGVRSAVEEFKKENVADNQDNQTEYEDGSLAPEN